MKYVMLMILVSGFLGHSAQAKVGENKDATCAQIVDKLMKLKEQSSAAPLSVAPASLDDKDAPGKVIPAN